jgi:hypothetical protein
LIQLSEEGERKLADSRMRDWACDQEQYEKKLLAQIEERRPHSATLSGGQDSLVTPESSISLQAVQRKVEVEKSCQEECLTLGEQERDVRSAAYGSITPGISGGE